MDLFFPSQELEPDNRTKTGSRAHTCNLEKKILCIFNVFHDSPPWLQFLLPGSFLLGWKKFLLLLLPGAIAFARLPIFARRPFHRELRERLFLEARSVYIECGKRLPGLYAFEGLYALKSDEYVNSIVFLPSSSSPIRCVRIGTLTVNFENVVARHRWRILSVNIYALLSEYTYIYT